MAEHTHFVYHGPQGGEVHNGYWWCSIVRPENPEGEKSVGVIIMAGEDIDSLAGKMIGMGYYKDGETEVLAAPIPDAAWNDARDILGPITYRLIQPDEAKKLMAHLDNRLLNNAI